MSNDDKKTATESPVPLHPLVRHVPNWKQGVDYDYKEGDTYVRRSEFSPTCYLKFENGILMQMFNGVEQRWEVGSASIWRNFCKWEPVEGQANKKGDFA